MSGVNEKAWALITARGGSKSVPLKNLAPLAGKPLLAWGLEAAQKSSGLERIFCSTDHDGIADFCRGRGVEIQPRPGRLSGDNVSSLDVILYFVETAQKEFGGLPEMLALLEPTSPFVKPEQIDACIRLLESDPGADSAQTVTTPPPNHHAYNQREILDDGSMVFRFAEERTGLVNKQSKPKFYVHGNFRVMRTKSLLENRDIFGKRSLPMEIGRLDAMDVDGPEDFKWAEALIAAGLVG